MYLNYYRYKDFIKKCLAEATIPVSRTAGEPIHTGRSVPPLVREKCELLLKMASESETHCCSDNDIQRGATRERRCRRPIAREIIMGH